MPKRQFIVELEGYFKPETTDSVPLKDFSGDDGCLVSVRLPTLGVKVFTAHFDDGPMKDCEHIFVGADVPFPDLYAMPNPTDPNAPWIIVGYTGLESAHAWPGQVHYRLLATELLDEPVGHYTLAAG